jgi:uncharacterized protein (TIGR01777 family)
MRVLITGGTGLIGTALINSLLEEGHQVWALTRNPQTDYLFKGAAMIHWDGKSTTGWGDLVSQMDTIVNLAGESIGAGPWTRERKARILASRVDAGNAIAEAIRQSNSRPRVLIQASAVGFYGMSEEKLVTEDSPAGSGFLTDICLAWEASTRSVEEMGVRRAIIRTGVVLSPENGAMARMMLPFKLFAGGPLGNGKQGLPWIHLSDEVAAIRFLIENENARGVFNLSAPGPISNAEFGKILAKAMKRPYWLPVPAFVLRLVLGEMSTLVLEGQYMLPERLLKMDFKFQFKDAVAALSDLVG